MEFPESGPQLPLRLPFSIRPQPQARSGTSGLEMVWPAGSAGDSVAALVAAQAAERSEIPPPRRGRFPALFRQLSSQPEVPARERLPQETWRPAQHNTPGPRRPLRVRAGCSPVYGIFTLFTRLYRRPPPSVHRPIVRSSANGPVVASCSKVLRGRKLLWSELECGWPARAVRHPGIFSVPRCRGGPAGRGCATT